MHTVANEAARLTAAIAAGGELESLVRAVRERDRQRAHLQHQLDTLDGLQTVTQLDVRRMEKELRAMVKEWRAGDL